MAGKAAWRGSGNLAGYRPGVRGAAWRDGAERYGEAGMGWQGKGIEAGRGPLPGGLALPGSGSAG